MRETESVPASSRRGVHRAGVHSGITSDSGRKDLKWNFRLQPQTCNDALENTLKFLLFYQYFITPCLPAMWTEVDFL